MSGNLTRRTFGYITFEQYRTHFIKADRGELGFPSSILCSDLLLESRARHKYYKQPKDFDMDMSRLFEKARRTHEPGSESYGRTLLLQVSISFFITAYSFHVFVNFSATLPNPYKFRTSQSTICLNHLFCVTTCWSWDGKTSTQR